MESNLCAIILAFILFPSSYNSVFFTSWPDSGVAVGPTLGAPVFPTLEEQPTSDIVFGRLFPLLLGGIPLRLGSNRQSCFC